MSAAAAAAAVIPGTTSQGMPAASSASISSSSLPNTAGSPDLSRTTCRPARASRIMSALIDSWGHDGPKPFFPAHTRSASRRASSRTSGATSRSCTTMSASCSR